MDDPVTIAAVGYLNTAPLIEGLGAWEGAEVIRAVPARIAPMLADGSADIGLASVVDFARAQGGLVMIPSGMIGCDGPTLTVRLFSSVPIGEIETVYADTDSHTSVVLCDLLLRERHGVRAAFVNFDVREQTDHDTGWPETLLMIGDKVVTGSPPAVRYPHQIDLGRAWYDTTGLPFVYAAWMTRAERADDPRIRAAAAMLERTRLRNRARLDRIVTDRARASGWPEDLARRYIGQLLRFEPDARAREGVARFLDMAATHDLLPALAPRWMEPPRTAGAGDPCPR